MTSQRVRGDDTTPNNAFTPGTEGPLTQVRVLRFYWGSKWQAQPWNGHLDWVEQFFQFILGADEQAPPGAVDQLRQLYTQMNQYSLKISPADALTGAFPGVNLGKQEETTDPPRLVSDADIRTFLTERIIAIEGHEHTPNTLYFVYLRPDVAVDRRGFRSCIDFCAYHDWYRDDTLGTVTYAVVPYPSCLGCQRKLNIRGALTATSSNELFNAVTDPVYGRGWFSQDHGEIADVCMPQTVPVGRFVVRSFWSNALGRCVEPSDITP